MSKILCFPTTSERKIIFYHFLSLLVFSLVWDVGCFHPESGHPGRWPFFTKASFSLHPSSALRAGDAWYMPPSAFRFVSVDPFESSVRAMNFFIQAP